MTFHDAFLPGKLGAVAEIDGQDINVRNPDDAIATVMARLRARRGFTFATLNLDHLVKLRENAAFRAAYRRMTLVSADGAPVAALARSQYADMRRATGADLLRPLCEAAARENIPVAFFGSTKASLETAAARLRAEIPNLAIAFLDSPEFGFDPCSEEAERLGRADRRQRRAPLLCLPRRAQAGAFRRPAGAKSRRHRLRRRGRLDGFHRGNAKPRPPRSAGDRHGMGLAPGVAAPPARLALCPVRRTAGANRDRAAAFHDAPGPWLPRPRSRRMIWRPDFATKIGPARLRRKSVLTHGANFAHRPQDRHWGKPCNSCVAPPWRPRF